MMSNEGGAHEVRTVNGERPADVDERADFRVSPDGKHEGLLHSEKALW